MDGAISEEDRIQIAFERFHAENPHVFDMFTRFAMEMRQAGYSHGSAGLIFERIRWELRMETISDENVALNNNYRSRYARLFEDTYPEWKGFFRKRRLSPRSSNSTRYADPIYAEGTDP
jgi:hypothetical protein